MLKLIALISMTIDHIGAIIFPDIIWLRIIGRFAFPLFAFLIAEGCFYTRSRKRYLGTVLAVWLFCQLVFFFSQGSLEQCILLTFALSIVIIYSLDNAVKKRNFLSWIIFVLCLMAAVFICVILPMIIKGFVFSVDYGIFGVLTPVFAYIPNLIGRERIGNKFLWDLLTICLMEVMLLQLCFTSAISVQWVAMFSPLLIFFYNGRRGRLKLKYFFYIFYPVHMGVIYLISTII